MGVRIGASSEIPPGSRKFVKVNGDEVAVINVDGEFFAMQNFCPHMGGPIGFGKILARETEEGETVTTIACPYHGWRFDVETGEPMFNAKKKITKYDVTEKGGNLYIDD
jgi:nitrite reductase/ring-hydroxylating ferredoxin subunit